MTIRTLFIGMDGSTFTILNALTSGDNPVMPFMKKLFAEGVRGKLRSTPNPLTPPAWVSLMTGRSPGNHGLYDFLKSSEVNGELYTELYSATDCQVETIWSIASRQGKKIAALNLPFTAPPPRDLNGIILPGFIPWKHLKRNTQPKDFYSKLKEDLPGFDPKELAWDFEKEEQAIQHLTDQERQDWVTYHLPREEQWFNVAKYVLTTEQPDLLAVMFDGTDKLQHQVWRFIDPDLQHDNVSDYHKAMRELTLKYFAQLDGHVRDLITAAGDNVQVFMASDHGFTAQKDVLHINSFLKESGYLKYKEASEDKASSFFATIDLAKTTAYCRTPSSNGITIRVKNGWNDTGINADDYDAFRTKLIEELYNLTDSNGEKIITAVHTREEVFAGGAMENAPDLTLTLRDHGFVSIKDASPVVQKLDEVIGTHHPDGVFIAFGKGIKQGVEIERRNIVDVAATLLYSLGLPVPEDFEGVVPTVVFADEYLTQNPVVIGAKTNPPSHGSTDEMSGEEKDALMRQLAALGYAE
ncbi:MAG: nucleotide pyrophosphatase [Rickettsiaceae bacterium]|jgi:predicted AlkP superfamily phosphohydrolase/phosphomutase|nr:nucleotide pyrophosphatase [Rickettsiaceae bacterium]